MTRRFATLDVFTDRALAGNPLAIVEEAEGLDSAQMQAIAREFNLSETVFVLPPDLPGHAARLRIFTTMGELPFAGHPTIGTAIHLATTRHGPDFEGRLVLGEKAGPVPVRIWSKGGRMQAELTAPVLPELGAVTPARTDCAAALGVAENDLGALVPQLWRGGPGFLYIELASLDALARARPIQPGFDALMAQVGELGVYVFAAGEGCDFQGRMFAPAENMPEDPATGSATAILAGPLVAQGRVGEGETVLQLRQGVEMGRPSELVLRIEVEGGQLRAAHVAGSAVPVMRGEIDLPGV
ncbi:PhzF family phenazine biosynthesis protein [Thioclava pacifica]|uniref:Phenazine biosynthesis protein PhzF n=1 Tax=Thioclava pacifica DSM 10166 TaxID=1353537 RepID=A0A074JK31_9RHOB|nr:PhzF family phenazine biosynthesis protein [Thioclava pacifica]KEO55953.1 hypothetical protein TP2_00100 [Thioclava pacifica DSM 10166]